jgi:hypothetical protein
MPRCLVFLERWKIDGICYLRGLSMQNRIIGFDFKRPLFPLCLNIVRFLTVLRINCINGKVPAAPLVSLPRRVATDLTLASARLRCRYDTCHGTGLAPGARVDV